MPDLCAQSGEKLLMDIVKAAVTENHDHVFWPEHRNDSVHNCVRILLVERGPAGLSDRRNDPLRFSALIFGDLFDTGDLQDKYTVDHFERFRELLLKHRT